MTGLSAQGITIKRLDEIKSELDSSLQLVFGTELSLDPSSPEAQLNGIIAEQISQLYELAQAVYVGMNPNFSTGNMLDLVSQIRGVDRNEETATVADVTFTGLAGITIVAGSKFTATGLDGITFSLQNDTVIDALGFGYGRVSCNTLGKVIVPALTITGIISPTYGLESVSNPLTGITGNEQETDEIFRIRSNASVALPGTALLDSVYASIANVDEVEQLVVLENDTSTIDVNGVSPKSMLAVVQGGTDEDIAEAIFLKKSLGCGMDGAITVSISDINGLPHDIRFSRPVNIPIFISVEVKELAEWDAAVIENIKQLLYDFATTSQSVAGTTYNGYQMGDDVYAYQLYASLLNENTYAINSLFVGIAAIPAGSSVPISFSELATFDIINISVVSVA